VNEEIKENEGALSHYTLLFSKNEFERALVALALGTKNPREEDWFWW
jgi:hypothetical protein